MKPILQTIEEKLCAIHPEYPKPFFVDYASPIAQKKIFETNRKDPLRKTLGKFFPGDVLWDFTFGLGFDALHFAALGIHVVGWERSPEIYQLVMDGMKRATALSKFSSLFSNIQLNNFCALDLRTKNRPLLRSLLPPRYIYLDPMYPEPEETSRKKKLQKRKKNIFFLREFAGDDLDAENLLQFSASIPSVERIILKRPLKEMLIPCSYSIFGKSHRFDVMLHK